MKVVTAKEMARIEQMAYKEGASEEGFMDKAAQGIAESVQSCIGKYRLKPRIVLLCGRGNNAGDAYAAGCFLRNGGFHVHALALSPFEEFSELCQKKCKSFVSSGGTVEYIKELKELSFSDAEILVDGILGTGFHGDVEGLYKEVIQKANASRLVIISIDVPSGINGTSGQIGGEAIKASETVFLGLPKSGCFYKEAWNYTGSISVYDFGLPTKFIDQAKEEFILIDDRMIQDMLPVISRGRHKYEAGYVVGLGGSAGMPGAAIMASFSSLRAGAGIVRLLHPAGMEAQLSNSPFEIIRQGYAKEDKDSVANAMERASAVFIGPGIGTSEEVLDLLKVVLPTINCPCVIDADALTLIANHPVSLPQEVVLTPHHGEMKKLLRSEESCPFSELLEKCKRFCEEKKVTLVLKGAPTFIFHPGMTPFVCGRGDPGMATAGSGDVLTGVIAALAAQTKNSLKGALLGVHIHALAGERASSMFSPYSMVATDIIHSLPLVFKEISSASSNAFD